MWPNTRLTNLLNIEYPIVQAGMAGGITTPELVAAVSNSGGLGTLGAGYQTPAQIRADIREIRSLTSQPFAVNLFIPQVFQVSKEHILQMQQHLEGLYARFDAEMPKVTDIPNRVMTETFHEQLQVVLDEGVPIFSFTFGVPDEDVVRLCKQQQVVLIGTATTIQEAKTLQQAGVDVLVAQGSEAGGHRGSFLRSSPPAGIGTFALVPQIADEVNIPVIAAGGIMDGRGIAASLMLGADGAQLGTAFLTCDESGTHPSYKQRVLESTDESTVLTRVFSGKWARGIYNEMVNALEDLDTLGVIPEYPIQNTLTRSIRQAAGKQNQSDYMSLWAGQGSALAKKGLAKDLMEQLTTEVKAVLDSHTRN